MSAPRRPPPPQRPKPGGVRAAAHKLARNMTTGLEQMGCTVHGCLIDGDGIVLWITADAGLAYLAHTTLESIPAVVSVESCEFEGGDWVLLVRMQLRTDRTPPAPPAPHTAGPSALSGRPDQPER